MDNILPITFVFTVEDILISLQNGVLMVSNSKTGKRVTSNHNTPIQATLENIQGLSALLTIIAGNDSNSVIHHLAEMFLITHLPECLNDFDLRPIP